MAGERAFNEDALINRELIPSEEDLLIIESRIATVEQEILALDQSIARRQIRRFEKVELLQKLRSVRVPIKKLPLELLGEIFRCLLALYKEDDPDGDQITLPWKAGERPWQFDLMQTCSRWRQAARDSLFLWSNFLIVAPNAPTDEDYTWTGKEAWVEILKNAEKLFPSNTPLIAGVDITSSDIDFITPSDLAVEHLYNPIMRPGRQISTMFRGYSSQLCQLLHSRFGQPELLEHVIVRDLGTGGMWFDEPLVPLQEMPNFHRLDWIAEDSENSLIFGEYDSYQAWFPCEQLTHLLIRHAFRPVARSNSASAMSLSTLRACRNLTHLTIISAFLDEYDYGDWMFWPEYSLDLPHLKVLSVRLDMRYFFKYLKLPSLSSLEVWNKKAQALSDINTFITKSGCSIESFIEGAPNLQSRSEASYLQPDLHGFLENLCTVKTLKTYTLLDIGAISDIASGKFLPSIEILQFYSDLSINTIITLLKPRFRNPTQSTQHQGYNSLKELTVNCPEPTFAVPFYVGGTVVRVVHEKSTFPRIDKSEYDWDDFDD